VHRDLKPKNIMVEEPGTPQERLKILDFGIAKVVRPKTDSFPGAQMTQGVLGTPDYLAPEQIRGQDLDCRTDMYAAGIILHQMLSGEFPFEGATSEARMAARLVSPPRPLGSKVPAELRALVEALLEVDRDKRPRPSEARRLVEQETRSRKPFVLAGAGVVGLAAVAAVVWFLMGRDGSTSTTDDRDPAEEGQTASLAGAPSAAGSEGTSPDPVQTEPDPATGNTGAGTSPGNNPPDQGGGPSDQGAVPADPGRRPSEGERRSPEQGTAPVEETRTPQKQPEKQPEKEPEKAAPPAPAVVKQYSISTYPGYAEVYVDGESTNSNEFGRFDRSLNVGEHRFRVVANGEEFTLTYRVTQEDSNAKLVIDTERRVVRAPGQ
jgi:serine/threonine protein kinase